MPTSRDGDNAIQAEQHSVVRATHDVFGQLGGDGGATGVLGLMFCVRRPTLARRHRTEGPRQPRSPRRHGVHPVLLHRGRRQPADQSATRPHGQNPRVQMLCGESGKSDGGGSGRLTFTYHQRLYSPWLQIRPGLNLFGASTTTAKVIQNSHDGSLPHWKGG